MSGWNRRNFLKASAFGTAGLAIENKRQLLVAEPKPWNGATARSLRKYRNPAPTVCRMCAARCGILAFRDGDRVAQVMGNTGAPTNQGGICARALAGLERLYDPRRQLRPLRRKGPRGSGAWEPIPWEEALRELGDRLFGHGGTTALHLAQEEILVEDLRQTLGWDHILVDRLLPGRLGPGSGERWYGSPVLYPDVIRAHTVYMFSAGPLGGRFQLPLARDLVRARADGADLHYFSSVEGTTGSLAEWHAVPPGAEAEVAWGMARLLLEWESYDRDELAEHLTDSPEALLEALAPFTPDAVEASTGLTAVKLISLARSFARNRPSLALAPSDSAAGPAAALLNHLVGAINRPGGVPTARGPFFVKPLSPTESPESFLENLVTGKASTDLYWVVDANPVYDAPASREVRQALQDPKRVGFLVAMDTHLTETASLADLFLPLATHFESWGLVEGALPDGRPYLYLQQPVTQPVSEPRKLKDPATDHLNLFEPSPRPLGQARGLPDVLIALVRGGVADRFPFEDSRAYLWELLRKSWGPGSLEALHERGVWMSGESRPARPLKPVTLIDAVPEGPSEPRTAGALRLLPQELATLPRTYAASRWGREIAHRSEALVNPATAEDLGVRDGHAVRLETVMGAATVPIRRLAGVHPDAIVLPDGFGHEVTGGGEDPGTVWWSEHGPGASLRALYPFRVRTDGTQDWGPLPVKVSKA